MRADNSRAFHEKHGLIICFVSWALSSRVLKPNLPKAEVEAVAQKLVTYPPNKVVRLDNAVCIYCGNRFGNGVAKTEEHVIGRKFVLKGSLNKGWNLIAWACETCNGNKADLEDDISAISMHPDLYGRFACDDPRLPAEALRKAQGANSRRTGRRVGDSLEKLTFTIPIAGCAATMTFNMTGLPTIGDDRMMLLAKYHVQAFFFWATFNESTKLGRRIPGLFALLDDARHSDWGNARMRGFMEEVRAWNPWVIGRGADEFFKIMIRRRTQNANIWAWAVEWNKNQRVIGLFGDEAKVRAIADRLPTVLPPPMPTLDGQWIGTREDKKLPTEEDVLFPFLPVTTDSEQDTGQAGPR